MERTHRLVVIGVRDATETTNDLVKTTLSCIMTVGSLQFHTINIVKLNLDRDYYPETERYF